MSFLGPSFLLIDRRIPSDMPWAATKCAAQTEDPLFAFFLGGASFVSQIIARNTGLSPLAILLICLAVINCLDWDKISFF